MPETEQPQIYLITPPAFDLATFPETLAQVLDAAETACLRLALSTRDEDVLARAADACREVAHARDVALVIAEHLVLAERLGLDGVHLTDAAKSVRGARKALGPDAIVGAFCGTSRHDGITAGEAGADYVSLGPLGGASGDGQVADLELFAWWSEMIEVPVIAEGALTLERAQTFAPVTDFLGLGEEIWTASDPATALKAYAAAVQI